MSKPLEFETGQKVRFKSHEELRRIGERWSIKVDECFKYTSKILTVAKKLYNGCTVKEWSTFSSLNYEFHKDFFRPVYELDDRFKGL